MLASNNNHNQTHHQSSKINIFNSDRFKHLLKDPISELSRRIQHSGLKSQSSSINSNNSGTNTSTSNNNNNNGNEPSNVVILSIENEALDHIEYLIFEVFNSILLASSENFLINSTPEAACGLAAMSSSSSSSSNISTSINSINSAESNLSSTSCLSNLTLNPILSAEDAELRVRQVLPRKYADVACVKAQKVVEKCRKCLTMSKRGKFLKTLNDLHTITTSISTFAQLTSPAASLFSSSSASSSSSSYSSSSHNTNPNHSSSSSSSSSSILPSSTNNELAQIFTFPIDRLHEILSKEIFPGKIELSVSIYLISILEYITKDILRLTTCYVSYLNKYTINKIDVQTAIHADRNLKKLLYSASLGGLPNINRYTSDDNYEKFDGFDNMRDLDDDDDDDDDDVDDVDDLNDLIMNSTIQQNDTTSTQSDFFNDNILMKQIGYFDDADKLDSSSTTNILFENNFLLEENMDNTRKYGISSLRNPLLMHSESATNINNNNNNNNENNLIDLANLNLKDLNNIETNHFGNLKFGSIGGVGASGGGSGSGGLNMSSNSSCHNTNKSVLSTTATSNNSEECTSDSSTICAESISFEQLNLKYNLKVKELIQEQSQHLNDLNILRRIFMYLFKKCCFEFDIKLNNELISSTNNEIKSEKNYEQLIENIFGNINDLYECALRLADLLDDLVTSASNLASTSDSISIKSIELQQQQQQQQQQIMVGQSFWELAEGDEFKVYLKYALIVTNYAQVTTCIKHVLNNFNLQKFLQQLCAGLVEISKYLLPKLLLGSIYHIVYLYETIEYLIAVSVDEEDKSLLNGTLDTLCSIKRSLGELGFTKSRLRPIETSLRMFQPQQLHQLNYPDLLIQYGPNGSSSVGGGIPNGSLINSTISNSSINNISQASTLSSFSNNSTKALVSNTCSLTKRKWFEIETSVESFKLPTNINQPISQSYSSQSSNLNVGLKSNNSSASSNTYNSNMSNSTNPTLNLNMDVGEANIRNVYLYEGNVTICKTSQPIQLANTNNSLKTYLNSQKNFKTSKRFAYLFEGLFILVKKNVSNTNTLTNSSSSAKFSSRFKQVISLDKCHLIDLDDDCCFELQLFSGNSSSSGSGSGGTSNTSSGTGSSSYFTQQQQISSQQTNSSSTRSTNSNNQDNQECLIFMTETPKDKYDWMSMLCYAKYKLSIDKLLQTLTDEQNRNNPLPIPHKGYPFDEPDSPETILFEQSQLSPQYNFYNISSDSLSIKAATLIKLIERLTYHLHPNSKFFHTFLMCFREFCTPMQLLDLLKQRYDVPDLNLNDINKSQNYATDGIIERELLKRYKRDYQQPIRLKVINVVKRWINGYYADDFANDPDLLQSLHNFIEHIGQTNQRLQQLIVNVLQKKINSYKQQQQQQQSIESLSSRMQLISFDSDTNNNSSSSHSNNYPYNKSSLLNPSVSSSSTLSRSPLGSGSDNDSHHNNQQQSKLNQDLLPSSISNSSNLNNSIDNIDDDLPPFETHLEHSYPFDILTIHPVEFARQATLMESELFRAIKPSELISLGWNKSEHKHKLSPNLMKLINLSNYFIYWYAKCIVDALNLDERVAVVQRILDIAQYFYQMNNFSGVKEIYAAFESSSVIRLGITREKSAMEQHKMYAEFKSLFEDHDKGYLERLKKCNPPCVPFIGSHLTIIIKTQEYNKLHDENHKLKIYEQQQQQLKAVGLAASSISHSNIEASGSTSTNTSATDITNSNSTISSTTTTTTTQPKADLINFAKYRLLVERVTELLQYQNMSYKFRVHEKIRSFILEDIENCFKLAQKALETREDELFNSSVESMSGSSDSNKSIKSLDMIAMARPNPKIMVEDWLYNKSKRIEPKDKEAIVYPRIKRYNLKPPPPADSKSNKQSNLNVKGNSSNSNSSQSNNQNQSYNTNTLSKSNSKQIDRQLSANVADTDTISKSSSRSPLISRFDRNKNSSQRSNNQQQQQQQVTPKSQQTILMPSINLLTAPFIISSVNQQVTSSKGSDVENLRTCTGTLARSSSAHKQSRSTHKRSSSSIHGINKSDLDKSPNKNANSSSCKSSVSPSRSPIKINISNTRENLSATNLSIDSSTTGTGTAGSCMVRSNDFTKSTNPSIELVDSDESESTSSIHQKQPNLKLNQINESNENNNNNNNNNKPNKLNRLSPSKLNTHSDISSSSSSSFLGTNLVPSPSPTPSTSSSSNALTSSALASTSASTISSSAMFPNTNTTNNNNLIQLSFGSFCTVSTSSSSPSPPLSLLSQTPSQIQNQMPHLQTIATSSSLEASLSNQSTGSLSSSSMNAVLSSLAYGATHGPEKLSLSSADSSSSAPNSPPPNYDEVFDSPTPLTLFNSNNINQNVNYNNVKLQSSASSNINCFDNKTYLQRFNSQPLSSSMSNLRSVENNPRQQQQQQQQQHQIQNHNLNTSTMKSTTGPNANDSCYASSTTAISSLSSASSITPVANQGLNFKTKTKNQQSVFSFPDFVEQNEEIEVLRKAKLSSNSKSNFSKSPNIIIQQQQQQSISKDETKSSSRHHPFNLLLPPPTAPPPPPPQEPPVIPPLPSHFHKPLNMTPSTSQTSINSYTPAPPMYPPPLPPPPSSSSSSSNIGEKSSDSRSPPPVPARPKRK